MPIRAVNTTNKECARMSYFLTAANRKNFTRVLIYLM